MTPRTGTFMLVLLLSGCGGDSPSGPATPAPTDVPTTQQCRRYATALTSESKVFVAGQTYESEESGACTFDRTSATLRCTFTDSTPGCSSTRTATTAYASVADFVEEAAAVGRLRHQQLHMVTSGCNSSSATENVTYDAMKRLLAREYASSRGIKTSSTLAAWDALGRPTQQISDELTCAHSRWALTYDDAARTWVSRLTEAGTGPGCLSDYALTIAYDPDGNIVREATNHRGATSWLRTSTITSTDSVCF